ncbi:ECF-type sigma factor [Lacipirellula sp.]|uniref:ECF-type sigma factor n=1 Tax=Lacipirellula sp. TaxID=2691419 RepID=UPI003D0F7021
MPAESVSQWIASLKANDALAAQRLWDRYSANLIECARHKLGAAPKGMADEEDIAQNVFRSVCRGAAAGRFADVKDRDDLWWLLLAITKQKVVDHVRRESAQKRGGGKVAREGTLASPHAEEIFTLDWLVGDEPTPDYVVMLDEQNSRLFAQLRDDGLRLIAQCRIEGYTVPEIAVRLSISKRSVERKLQLIRRAWSRDLSGVE